MTVNPGYAGQKLVPQSLDKIHELKSYAEINNLAFDIEVDGNVSWENIPAMVMAGASVLVAGTSSLFQPGQKREDSLERLFQLIDKL
jgi:pentose-5-phosphate-3-epimerase